MHINKVYDIRGDSDAFMFLFTLFFFSFHHLDAISVHTETKSICLWCIIVISSEITLFDATHIITAFS